MGYVSVMLMLCVYFSATKLKTKLHLISEKDKWHNVINFGGNFKYNLIKTHN